MLKILWKRGKIAPEEQFLLLATIYCYLILDFYVKTRIRFSLRDKQLFEITEAEITRVDCITISKTKLNVFYNGELNALITITCIYLRKLEVSAERTSVCNVIEKLAEHVIH